MAIPSGSGTEVLRRGAVLTLSNSTTALKWDGTSPTTGTQTYTVPADHIITLLSMIWCETAGADELVYMQVVPSGGSAHNILREQSIPSKSTFIFNDKLVLHPGDKMTIELASAGDIDVYYSYIDQDWS